MGKTAMRLPEDDPVFGGNKIFDAFGYSPAVEAGGLLFIAGQVGIRADGSIPEDVDEQIDLAFRRVGAILHHRNLDFSSIVEIVSYHVDIDQHLDVFRTVKDRYIVQPFPAWTIIGVAALARPSLKIEIKIVVAV